MNFALHWFMLKGHLLYIYMSETPIVFLRTDAPT